MNLTAVTPMPETENSATRSTTQRGSPGMSHRTLSILLCLMAMVPPLTIGILWSLLPPLAEGQLNCEITAIGLPDPAIYQVKIADRPAVSDGSLVVNNTSDQPWTHINIWVNGYYQIYDLDPLPAGGTRVYELDRFVTRFGASYNLRYNQLDRALVYARMPKGNRATRQIDLKPVSEKASGPASQPNGPDTLQETPTHE